MSISPLSYQQSLQIGTVEAVSPGEICVLLDTEAPESVALNTGTPHIFPRVNGYVFIHTEKGFLVCQVGLIYIERSAYPKRKGLQDFGLIDLPFPLRKMRTHPLGVLSMTFRKEKLVYQFHRGVETFPSVGNAVLLPAPEQLKAIIESGEHCRVAIGTSPLDRNATVWMDPDRLLGRHCAILGNTGSGKSCSVAGLIRWSLEAAKQQTNARFIILDPNGEYRRAFQDSSIKARVFSAQPNDDEGQLHVPLWLWNAEEWCAIAQASDKMQKPLLRRALQEIFEKTSKQNDDCELIIRKFNNYLGGLISEFKVALQSSEKRDYTLNTILKSANYNFSRYINTPYVETTEEIIFESFKSHKQIWGDYKSQAESIHNLIKQEMNASESSERNAGQFNKVIDDLCIGEIVQKIECLVKNYSIQFESLETTSSLDFCSFFTGLELVNTLSLLARLDNCTQFIDPLVLRIRTMLSDVRIKNIIDSKNENSLPKWLECFLGSESSETQVTIVDLSLVPTEIIFIVTSVIARMILEALQRYRKLHSSHACLPTVLVMEEAHTFIRRGTANTDTPDAASRCCHIFEKIAREGRKFGLGLLISSQRPSELSPSVLSQCNTFLLHRISNDKDQEMVAKLVPDNLRGLLNDLPVLPSRQAIFLGWAAELPILVEMNELPLKQRPQSDDPDFWNVWTSGERNADWEKIAMDWQNPKKGKPEK